ncbi:outer membrane protein assembly factor BamE domain-containing protein [Microbulbifer pacificus]|uniref:Outer membrane protein assembly factor BamE n=1 Tax=Microbulbifer pacificus TaxID=407164 RepID=A0AAU0N0G0_9GAMM|nr:outer membrane protein assembly factor BamE [Microbulbifer pacificus]WOX05743.1 outer membrane protein assembly factor BamE [Microbulbifer pacificus]
MKKTINIVAVLCVSILTGCAGTNFKRLTNDQLSYGIDTSEIIRQKLGKPYSEGVITKNDKQFKTMSYAYASAGGDAAQEGVTAARSQGLYFYENKLVGDEFTSSWAVDSTDFDESKISQIKKGSTTISEVESLLGAPSGQYLYPLVTNENEKAKIYMYSQTKGSAFNLKFYQKLLVLSYDASGVVTNIEYTEQGSKEKI